jgi:hypothetical protein
MLGYNLDAFDLYGDLHYAVSAQPSNLPAKSSENLNAYLNKRKQATSWKQEQ